MTRNFHPRFPHPATDRAEWDNATCADAGLNGIFRASTRGGPASPKMA